MQTIDAETLRKIEDSHPDVFRARPWKQYGALLMIIAIVAYSVYCWWFFSVGHTLRTANWNIAGAYLADWISWEARPDIDIEADGAMSINYPRFSPLGAEPNPDWVVAERSMMTRRLAAEAGGSTQALQQKNANSFMVPEAKGTVPDQAPAENDTDRAGEAGPGKAEAPAPTTAPALPDEFVDEVVIRATIVMAAATTIEVTPRRVSIDHAGETLVVNLGPGENIAIEGTMPAWAEQKYAGRKVIAWFGFAGRAEIDYDGVKVRRRFLGWENFFFDTHSPYWGKSFAEVIGQIASGERIEPERSNLALAWNNFLYNSGWQHLDVWTKLLQTIVMAFVGTVFASLVAFPLAFMAARNITPNRIVNQLNKRFFDFLRSVDMLIWALFFTRAFGPGPLAGISAIFFTDTGTFGKLYSEALENIDDKQREGIRAVGANPVLVQRFGVLPQVLPVFISQSLYFWESNTRSATIIGAVGAGGIGLKLWEAMRTNQDWENVAYMVILILIVVFVFDSISTALRMRLINRSD